MKKIDILWMFSVMMLALPVSCVDNLVPVIPEVVEVTSSAGDSISFIATLEKSATKTRLNDLLEVVWTEGDQVKVFNAENPNGKVFTLVASSAGSSVGTFKGDVLSGKGPFYAVYPAAAAGTLSGGKVSIHFPGIQMYEGKTFAKDVNISACMSEALDQLSFLNVCGILALSVTGNAAVSELVIVNEGGEPLSGDAYVTPSLTGSPGLSWSEQGTTSSKMELVSAEGTSLSGGKDFFVVLPAGSLSGGFSLEVHDCDANAMVVHASASAENVIVRSALLVMPAVNYTPQVSGPWLDYGSSAAEKGFAGAFEDVGAGGSGGTASLLAWSEIEGQYAWSLPAEGPCKLRIQNWNAGYVLGITLESSELKVGKTYAATIETMGNAEGVIPAGETTMKVIKKEDGRIWLADGAKGYIMKTEED